MKTVVFEHVRRRQQTHAMRFLVAGDKFDELVDMQASSLAAQTIDNNPKRCSLWWALRGEKPVAAAMIYENAGNTGSLFASPAKAPGVSEQALVELIKKISDDAINRGLSLVQSILPLEAEDEMKLLAAAGYENKVDLVYMKLDLTGKKFVTQDTKVEFRRLNQVLKSQLEDVIRHTYENSLDCPWLSGLRKISDVIESHKASGIFHPQSWWIIFVDKKAAGCILVNDSGLSGSCEIIYLGVVPEFRGRGLGREMITFAAWDAARRGMSSMTLAVDDSNIYGKKLYESLGFRKISYKHAYVFTAKNRP